MTWPLILLTIALGSFALSWFLTRLCCTLAPRWGFIDIPASEIHHAHRAPTPVMGGLAMAVAWNIVILGSLAVLPLAQRLLAPEVQTYLSGVQSSIGKLLTIAAGTWFMTLLGTLDDRKAMHAKFKFLCQAVVLGAVATQIHISLFHEWPIVNWFVTTFWFLCVINALNFFDNMDGLAGGSAFIAAAFFLSIALLRGQLFVALLSAATMGTALGFLMLNRPPARIFMGDGGSHFLGYCLALAGVMTTFYQNGESLTPAPLLIPILVLSLPLFDAIAVVCIRLREHRPIYIGDTRHLSHRFTHLGLTRPQAVYLIWLLALIQGTGALTLIWLPTIGSVLIFLQEVAIFLAIAFLQFYIPIPEDHHA